MNAILEPSLNPATTRRRIGVLIAVAALALGLIFVDHKAPTERVGSPIPTLSPQTPTVSQPLPPSEPIQQGVALIDRAMAFIEPFEGRRHRVYRDSLGYRTVGVGFNLDRPGAAQDLDKLLPGIGYHALRHGDISLTEAQIDLLLRHDTQRAIDTARRQVTGFDDLPMDAQLIVIDMTFNTGSLHKWRKLRLALARQNYTAAADAMRNSRWRRQTGQRARHRIELMQGLTQG